MATKLRSSSNSGIHIMYHKYFEQNRAENAKVLKPQSFKKTRFFQFLYAENDKLRQKLYSQNGIQKNAKNLRTTTLPTFFRQIIA